MKEKKCCTVDVTKMENGLRLEITGEKVENCLSSLMSCCCLSKGAAEKPADKKRC
ncbi:MAG: hypothetical protein WCU88_11750 [Elusimicrobiota bacterium]|jgi:hypothetical protein